MKLHFGLPLIAIAAFAAAGCATPETYVRHQVAEVEAPLPPPPKLTPEQERDREDARQAYATCLRQAAHFANQKGELGGDGAGLVAPMCYPQFAQYQALAAVGMEGRTLRDFDRKGDKRQLEMATAAIQQERGLAELTPAQ
jgi:hypothetical protein